MLLVRTAFVSCLLAFALFTGQVSAQEEISRIVNGMAASINQFPHIVQLRTTSGFQFCGGTLISPNFVITAAHCFKSMLPQSVEVVGGATKLSDKGVVRRISKLHTHPEYSPSTSHSDIAILQLEKAMSGPNIRPMPLCNQSPVPGQNMQVSGWGLTDEKLDQGSQTLRTVQIPVRPTSACTKEFHPTFLKRMFCGSGLQAKGSCFGDSGGPATINNQLCGIVAFGYACGTVGRPTGFTNVYEMRPYIRSIVGF